MPFDEFLGGLVRVGGEILHASPGGGEAHGLLKDYLCVWSDAPELLQRSFLQTLARLCGTAFTDKGYAVDPWQKMEMLIFVMSDGVFLHHSHKLT